MLRLLEVCAGIGGISLGFEMTGHFQTVGFVEIDTYAQKILNKHWPDVPCYCDVRSVSAWTLPTADVLAGGIPCQPHSLAGKRGGADDERDLWPEFFRLVCETQPAYAVVENVPGLRSSDGGRFFGTILRDLAQAGYDAEWCSFPASAVGAPHQRERVWIVAYPRSIGKQRSRQKPLSRITILPRCQNGGSITDWRERSTIFAPKLCRVSDGIPRWMDRLRCLGNAVVPQCAAVVAEYIWQHWQSINQEPV